MTLVRQSRPMTPEEKAWFASERGGAPARLARELEHGAPRARRLEERLALDDQGGLVEVITLEPDSSAYVEREPRGLVLFEARAEAQVVLVSLAAVEVREYQGRGQLFGREGPIVIERAPASGLIIRLRGGRRAGERSIAPGWSPPAVFGCELVQGNFAAIDDVFSRCVDADLSERWALSPPHVIRYAGTDVQALPGDRVEMKRWLRSSLPATVLHVPGVSPRRPSTPGPTVTVRVENGDCFSMGCDEAGDALNLRFVSRGEPEPLPDDF